MTRRRRRPFLSDIERAAIRLGEREGERLCRHCKLPRITALVLYGSGYDVVDEPAGFICKRCFDKRIEAE